MGERGRSRNICKQTEPVPVAEFSAYWASEGKVFTQIQWEQKFARHVVLVRTKKQPVTFSVCCVIQN
ncbi:TPA: hypothetical protein I8190_001002 [Citrobacter freundii]|nr:hypothetical protein [Citrobacter freundii]HAT2348294.1 hypothetical protein [Citrobacter freundii]HAT2429884.1 hypothetical protein [Citrobacter freundii]HAT2500131.1 hypothetical protein [Citrobacter freundii]HEM8625350.1 hypothetical protein [Citrobacter farmeri]